ncbi:MAG: DUF4382 domain-containing protein [Candidatus Acidiferrales bacterium]|jgi:hypothetical protein
MRRAAAFFIIAVFSVFISGCGGGSSMSGGAGIVTNQADVPVSMTVTDTPPAGVTVLFFQLGISSASLTSSGGASVSLVSSATNPIPVNVAQLQTDSAFLGSANVPAGTYTSLSVTFAANPQLTIFNASGSTIGSGANACANNTICHLTPPASPSTLTFNTNPFPVTLSANSPLAFKLDIHLDTIIQPDLTVNLAATDGVTISQLPTPSAGAPISALGHLIGTVGGVTSSGFTLQTGDGRSFTIGVNSSTTYSYSSSVCPADNFTCVAMNQIVKVEVSLEPGGTLLAVAVDYVQPATQTVVEGNIVRLTTSGTNTILNLIVQNGPPTPTPNVLPFGGMVTVTVPSTGVTYAIDSDGFTLPSGLTFTSASSLAVGQLVSVVVNGSITTTGGSGGATPFAGPAAIGFSANSITLEPSQITGTIAGINAGQLSFALATLPIFFVPPAANATSAPPWEPVIITVQTTSATAYSGFTPENISGLYVNDYISVKGWVFSTPTGTTSITVAGESLLERPGPTPLF